MTLRTQRLASLLQSNLADILRRQVKDPRLSRVTLTGVDVSADLSYARVYFTLFDMKEREKAEIAFKSASSFLRAKLAAILHLKTIPKLLPVFDDTIDKAAHMDILIRKTLAEDEMLIDHHDKH
ncbi:MAG: 30S ribosome-binding factor RbfA [Desulfarculales bacterium]|jgi:ribosome-binding factor A|nr:30S ribosome-binding factor RbfA [Desulfarculales bacterium]